jgi:hypothetical protein
VAPARHIALWALLCLTPALAVSLLAARRRLPARPAGPWLTAALLGALGGLSAHWLERAVRLSYGLDVATALPLVLTFAVLAPAEEGLKIGALWPSLWMGGLPKAQRALALVTIASAGFAAGRGAPPNAGDGGDGWWVLGLALSVPAHALPSCFWGSALGRRDRTGRPPRWLPLVWALAVGARGVLAHALTLRTRAGALGAVGLLTALALISFFARIFHPVSAARVAALPGVAGRASVPPATASGRASVPPATASGRASVPPATASGRASAPPSLRRALDALVRRRRPLKPRRVFAGTFVLHGAVLLAAGSAFAVGGRLGLDVSALGRAGSGPVPVAPVAWVVGASLGAFPVGGFLLARASEGPFVAEVALAALFAASLFLAHLGLLAPTTLGYGVAGVPAAVALACSGAWFGGRAR